MSPTTPLSLEYQPLLSVAIVGLVLSAAAAFYQTFLYFKFKTWFFYWIVLSAWLHAVAFSLRTASVMHPEQKWLFKVSYIIFIGILSFLAAACHATFGRILQYAIEANKSKRRAFLLPIGAITPVFLGLDIAALGFQVLGAALICTGYTLSGPANPRADRVLNNGITILKWSLIGQLIYLGVFALITLRFAMIYRGLQNGLKGTKIFLGTLAWVAGVSSALIMLHVIYEVVELIAATNGVDTYFMKHEWVFCVVDILPVFIIYLAFSIVHPGKCLPSASIRSDLDEYESYDYHGLPHHSHGRAYPASQPKSVLDKPLPPLPSRISAVSYAPSRPARFLQRLIIEDPDKSSRKTRAFSEISPYESKKSYQAFMSGGL